MFRELPDGVRERQLSATLEQFQAEPSAATGLLEAESSGEREGVIWIQVQPGRVASLWPPQTASPDTGDSERIASTLLDAACELARRGGVRMIQALLATDAGLAADRVRMSNFEHVTDLLYLVSPASAFPTAAPDEGLQYDALTPAAESRFAVVVERTYRDTRLPAIEQRAANRRSLGRLSRRRGL